MPRVRIYGGSAMLNPNNRIIVEAIRKADTLDIKVGEGTSLQCKKDGFDPAFQVLRYDIAIAIQKYLYAKQHGQD